MKCTDAVDLVIDSLMDSLTDEQERRLAEHIGQCAACTKEAAEMKATWHELAELPSSRLEAGAAARLAVAVGSRASGRGVGRTLTTPLRAAAAIALMLLGGTVGYVVRGPVSAPGVVSAEGPTFLFLVRGEELDATVSGDVLTAEYRAWAAGLAGEGRLVAADKLTDEPGRWVTGASRTDDRTRSDVQGYFLISAPSYAEAEALAARSPHVRYGGTFEIRQIEPTG